MDNINVELITSIMRYIKSKEEVLVQTKSPKYNYEGIIVKFDGKTIQLSSGELLECANVLNIFLKPVFDIDSFIGSRVVIRDKNKTEFDGVVCNYEDNTVSIITDKGIENVKAGLILDIDKYDDTLSEDLTSASSCGINESDKSILNSDNVRNKDVSDDINGFKKSLLERNVYLFDEELAKISVISGDEKKECLEKFNNQEYYYVLDILEKRAGGDSSVEGLIQYLKEVIDRYEVEKKNLNPDGTLFSRGIIASKIENNPDKAFDLFVKSIEENPGKAKDAIYKAVSVYLSSRNYERGVEVLDFLIGKLKNVKPEYDQANSLKVMLILCQNANEWDKYLDILEYLVEVSRFHPISCTNIVLRYTKALEKEKSDPRIIDLYKIAISMGERQFESILRLCNYACEVYGPKTAQSEVEKILNGYNVNELWNEIQEEFFNLLIDSSDRYSLIDELVRKKDSDIEIEKQTDDTNEQLISNVVEGDSISFEVDQKLDEKSKLEQQFKKHRDKNDYKNARGHFSSLLKKHENDSVYIAINLRAELYFNQYMAYINGKNHFSEHYEEAMLKWLAYHEPEEAERIFKSEIMKDSPSKGTVILSYIDMIAVEYGLEDALKVLLGLQMDIRYCDRTEKVAFYEKKYTFAYTVGDISNALNALETLRSTYYNKMKLGNCWYRTGECYWRQSKWKQAKNSYEKAIEYGYMKNVCSHQIDLCRRNMGELIDTDSRIDFTELESIDKIREKVEAFYNQLKYKEANKYVSELAESYPDNEEIIALAKTVGVTLQRYIDNAASMPKRTDSQAIALRAWHIENNYSKAKRYFEDEIKKKGSKYFSCIMDLSDLLFHTEGIEAAISWLKSYESEIRKLKVSEQSGFYEKMYSLFLKNKDIDKIIEILDELINIYASIGKKDKVAFSYYRAAIICYQDKRYEQTITKMLMAIKGGYHSNACYKCVAFSYAYLNKFDDAFSFVKNIGDASSEIDSTLQITIKEIEDQVKRIRDASLMVEGAEDDEKRAVEIDEINSEFMLGFNTRFEAFFVERYGTNPVGISIDKFEQCGYRESDISRLESDAWQHQLRERTGFFWTAAYIENQINGNSYKYYELLRNSANSWGFELQNNGFFNCACACFEFSLENDVRIGRLGKRSAVAYLSCVARIHKFNMPDTDEDIKRKAMQLISSIMDLEEAYGENILRELILLINKSKFIREILLDVKEDNYAVWISQLANYISSSKQPTNYKELFELISKKCWQDENALLDFSNKVRNSKAFNEDQLTELRSFKSKIFLFDTDIKYLDSLVNAYEKGIEIYDYEDYDNRMATIGNVQNQLHELMNTLNIYPTYFGINFLSDIVENLLEILLELSKKTKEELKPELTVQIPISDVPVVGGKQGISVTVFNKENAASAKEVRLRVADIDGNKLTDDISIAQYLRGGRSASKELEIPSQGETYTVKLLLSYIDHADERQFKEEKKEISSAKDIFETIKSPYFTGDSIDVSQPSIFVGRDVLLDTLENALVNNKSGCEIIYGQKRCGKSSIANFLEDRLKESFLIIKFSIGAARSAKSIYTNVRDLIIEKIENLIDSEDEAVGIDEELLNEIEHKKIDEDEDFVSLIRLVHRKLCRPLGKEILLMIDEFTHLYRYVKEDRRQVAAFMDTWKKLLEADLFKAVLIGQDTMPNFIKEFQNQFQVTQPIRVDRLDDDSVRKLIEEPLRLSNGESRFMENSVELIASWFFGQPYYIQLYCDRLVEQMNIDKRVRVTNALAEKVKALMLEEANEDLFDNLISVCL